MALLPIEILFGVYLGLLAGIVPALIAGVLAFLFRYVTGATLPGLGVVVLAVAVAGVSGGLLGLLDPTIIQSPRLMVALLIVMMLALYAHRQGDALGATMPRRFSLQSLRRQTLSTEVIDIVEGRGQVTVKPTGSINDIEGFPPLSTEIRRQISKETWRFPADLPLSELERRLGERLQTEYDLADVAVSIDTRGRATLSGAPHTGGLSRRIPPGHRAVSIRALVPTGLARRDEVTIRTDDGTVEGTIVSARSDSTAALPVIDPVVTDGGREIEGIGLETPLAPTTVGGEGKVTVAVSRTDSTTLLQADRGRVLVQSRGTRREFELVSLFRRGGARIRRVTVPAGGALDGTTLAQAHVRETYEIAVLAVRQATDVGTDEGDRHWMFSPRGRTALSAGDELFVVGVPGALNRFEEAIV